MFKNRKYSLLTTYIFPYATFVLVFASILTIWGGIVTIGQEPYAYHLIGIGLICNIIALIAFVKERISRKKEKNQ